MLTFQQIKQSYPPKLQQFERHIFREYLQYKILAAIFQSRHSSRLSFLGGTALRIVHGNHRFSEDLDFDNDNLSQEEFEEIIAQVERSLSLEGIAVEIRNVYRAAYYCYLKFPRLLYEQGLTPQKREKILIRLDTAPQNFKHEPEVKILTKFDVTSQILVTPLAILLAQKILTALERKRAKGRDFFDLVFLLSQFELKPDRRFLAQKLDFGSLREAKEALLQRASELDLRALALDVRPFLFDSTAAQRVEQFEELVEAKFPEE